MGISWLLIITGSTAGHAWQIGAEARPARCRGRAQAHLPDDWLLAHAASPQPLVPGRILATSGMVTSELVASNLMILQVMTSEVLVTSENVSL